MRRDAGWCRLRDKLDKMLASDRMLSLMVAMESALDDARYEVSTFLLLLHKPAHWHACLVWNVAVNRE
jgi:hypothetical protein